MTPTNWPNPERPGMPPNPDVSGWHWVMRLGELLAVKWDAQSKSWKSGNHSYYTGPDWVLNWEYCSPILTPTQLAELLAGERERCVEALQEVAEEYRKNAEEVGTVMATNSAEEKIETVDDCWVKIRSLGAAP